MSSLFITTSVAQQWTNYTNVSPANSIAVDQQDNVWIGGSGITKFDGTNWTSYLNTYIRIVAIDAQGDVWAGTDGLGLYRYHAGSWIQYTMDDGLVYNRVFSIVFDSLGNTWVGCADPMGSQQGGVSKFSGSTWTNYTIQDGLISNYVMKIAIDHQGHFWFGTRDGISFFDGTNWTNYTTADGLVFPEVCSILIDAANHKWFGTYGGGLSEFDGTNWITHSQGSGNYYWDGLEDESGNLWFGTADGIRMYDGSSWTTYTTSDGLIENHVYSIDQNSLGEFWFGTYDGISKLSFLPLGLPTVPEKTQDFNVFPMPATSTMQITLPANFSGTTSISLKNMQGQMVYQNLVSPASFVSLDVSRFAEGLYLLSVTRDNITQRQKVIIAR